MTDLTFVSLEELIAELRKRYDVVLVGLIKDKTKDDSRISCFWHGGRVANVGLAEHIKRRLLDDIDEDMEEVDA
jgi:ABC-type phosphate transport system ATPase subunit